MAQKDFKIGVLDTSNAKIRSNGFFTSLTSKSDLASNVTLVLPDSVGTNGQVLTTDGSGNLSFASSVNTTSIWVDGILNSNSALILESGGGLSIDSNTTTNIITLTADSSDVDLVQSNLSALPDSAANDHVTYTTLSGLIDTVQENVVSSDNNVWVNANDHTTYTTITSNVYNTYVTLLGYVDGEVSNLVNGAPSQLDTLSELSAALENDANLAVTLTSQIGQVSSNASTNATNIDLVQSNVTSLPDSAANDHVTYTTLSGLIDTVQSNIVSSDNNAWVNANDYATYTTLSGLVNTVNANVDALPDSAANDFATYTTLKGEVNTVNSNLVSHISGLPDSAANDFATYTTLLGEINIVNSNVTAHIDALPDHVANDFTTYTTLLGEINSVNSNVEALPDSAANDYATYNTLVGLIDTVQGNVVSSDNNVWVNANDYATYSTLLSVIDTVQSNVYGIPNSAANDYTTYTTLISRIDTVQDNVAQNVHQIATTGNTTTNSIEVAGLKTDSLQIGNTDLTATASELNIIDGDTTATSTTVATGDRVVLNDSGTMVQVDVDDLDTYFSSTTQTLNNKTLRGPTFEGGSNSPEFLEQRYVNATQMEFVQLYTGSSSGSYFTNGEYQKIATITPSSSAQNYTFIIRMTATSASNYQIVTFTGALRSNNLPDLSFTTNFNEEHNGVRFIEPKLWTKETTTAGFILAFEYIHSSNLYGGVNVEAIIIPRDDSQRNNVSFNTTQNSEQSSIDTGFTENDPNLVYSQVNGTMEFGTQFKIEGSTKDGNELTITATDPTADRTATFPDATGHVALFAADPGSTTISSTPTELNLLSGVTGLATATDFQANDYATYTATSALVDSVQANLTSDIAVLTSFGTYANSTFAIAGEGSNFSNLDVDNITVAGDLTILGNTTTIESVNTVITDPLLLLNNGVSGSNTVDIGIIFNRGTDANAAFMYDESEDVFQFGFTQQGGDASDLIYSSLAGIRADAIRAGNVELGTGDDRNEITTYGNKDLIISANTLQATNIQIASNVIPTQNAVFSIGSPTAQIKDLYLSDGTLYIGSTSNISASTINVENFNVNSDGTISIPGVSIQADANAVDTVEIVASDLASNAHIQNQIEITVGDKDDLTTRVTTNLVAAINSTAVDLAALGSYANTTFATASDATSDQFIISSANTFTMGTSVSEANNVLVSISGLMQLPNDDYIVSGTTLTLNNTTPLPIGAAVEVRHLDVTGSGSGAGASSTESWSIVTSDTTLSANTNYFIDTSSSAIEVTLPASPVIGTGIKIVDMAGSAGTNNITVGRNSEKIQRLSQDLIVNADSASFKLVFSNSTYGWIITEDTVTG